MTARNRLGRLASSTGLMALVVWIACDLFGRIANGTGPWHGTLVDYRIIYDSCREILANGRYPELFPYPPPTPFLLLPVSTLPFPLSSLFWLGFLGLSAVTCWLTLASLLRWNWNRGDYLLLPLAHVSCSYFFQWDLRSANCNLIVLQLTIFSIRALHREKSVMAGFWLALSISLKLYTFPIVAYYLWIGRRRAVAVTLGWLVALWVFAPLVTFGPAGTLGVYEGWIGNLCHAMSGNDLASHPILTSLERAGAGLAGERGQFWLPLAGKIVWAAIFVAGWRLALRRRRMPDDAYGLLADLSIFTLLPVALSPYLEPYHAVPFAIPAALLITAGADFRQSFRLRLFAWLMFAATWAVMKLPIPFIAKGLLINVKLALGIAGVIGIAACRNRVPGTQPDDSQPNRQKLRMNIFPYFRLTNWHFTTKTPE